MEGYVRAARDQTEIRRGGRWMSADWLATVLPAIRPRCKVRLRPALIRRATADRRRRRSQHGQQVDRLMVAMHVITV